MNKVITAVKKPRGEGEYKIFSIRMPERLVDALDKVAEEANFSRNAMILLILESSLNDVVVQDYDDKLKER